MTDALPWVIRKAMDLVWEGEPEAWEGVAGDVLACAGMDGGPVDAYELADACGLDVVHLPGGTAHRVGNVLAVPATGRRPWDHYQVAHEIGHWALERAGEPDSEAGADYLACALLLPRAAFEADLRATHWNPAELRQRYPSAAASAIVRRIAMLRPALGAVWDERRLVRRVVGAGLRKVGISKREADLAHEAFSSGELVRGGNLAWAAPVFSGGRRRVVTIVDAEAA